MAKFKAGRRSRSGSGAGGGQPARPTSGTKPRRTPMGIADAKASNNLLVGIGVGLITTVTGLSAAGTFTAINAMNRQSEEAIAETERHQEELARKEQELLASKEDGAGGAGTTVQYPEDPSQAPVDVGGEDGRMTREEWLKTLPAQVRWMIEKKITYDEYGLPRDEYGSLMNDPTTDIYDPARWSYFFDSNNEEKSPKRSELPTQAEVDDMGGESGEKLSDQPVVAPDKDPGYTANYDEGGAPIQNPTVDRVPAVPGGTGVTNPVVDPGGQSGGDGTGPTNPVVAPGDHEGEWWKDSTGKLLDGLSVDENGSPYYVVRPGDTLNDISDRYGFSVDDVVSASRLVNPGTLYVGDIIRFPADDGSVQAPGRDWWVGADGHPLNGIVIDGGEPTYVVKPGDTASSVADMYGFEEDDIVSVNGIRTPDSLEAGEVLRFPEGNPVTAPSVGTDWWREADGTPIDGITIGDGGPVYVAGPGDTTGTVADRFGFEEDDIVSTNGLRAPGKLAEGTEVKFPASGPTRTPNPSGTTGTSGQWWIGSDGKALPGIVIDGGKPTYVVKPGDTLSKIASSYGFGTQDLVSANQLKNPNVLTAGQVLKFPSEGPSKTPSPSGVDGVLTGDRTGGSAPGRG